MKKSLIYLLFFSLVFSCKKEEPVSPVNADFDFKVLDDGKIEFVNKSVNAISYDWDFNDGNSSKEMNPAHTFTENKDYLVNLTARGNSGQSTVPKTIKISNIYDFSGNWSGKGVASYVFYQNDQANTIKVVFGKKAGSNIGLTIIESRNNQTYDVFDFVGGTISENGTLLTLDETNFGIDKITKRKCTGTLIIKNKQIIVDFTTSSSTAGFRYLANLTKE